MKKVNLEMYLDKDSWHKIPIGLLEDWLCAYKIWKRKRKNYLTFRESTPKSVNEMFERWNTKKEA